MKTGVELIADERQRQIDAEGWTADHDDEHDEGQMAIAGACYEDAEWVPNGKIPHIWPWDAEWWKPTPKDPTRNLVKAGALYQAEVDRLNRKIILVCNRIDGLNCKAK